LVAKLGIEKGMGLREKKILREKVDCKVSKWKRSCEVIGNCVVIFLERIRLPKERGRSL
jgi:hypothetical protein